MARDYDVAVVGAGAAGLAAGIFAAEAGGGDTRVVLLDGAKRLGAKILIAGGGRCNVTHDVVRPEDFNGARPIVRNILKAFDEKAVARWFEELGVPLKREPTGKLFPVSDRARSVLDALVGRCVALGVEIRTAWRVVGVDRNEDAPDEHRFVVRSVDAAVAARRVVLATGGRSVPKTGSDGSGYAIARALGHTVTATWPALVPLVLAPSFFHGRLKGVSQEVELTTRAGGRIVDRRDGSLLWTHFGISGPVVLDASRHWVGGEASGAEPELVASFVPRTSFEEVDRRLARAGEEHPRRSVEAALGSFLPDRFAAAIARHAGLEDGLRLAHIGRGARRRLARALTALPLPVMRARGWDHAEVTAGGVPLGEVDFRTMASRRADGVHLAGEILDCEGRIGGFNFQWAWSTGFLAGRGAVRP